MLWGRPCWTFIRKRLVLAALMSFSILLRRNPFLTMGGQHLKRVNSSYFTSNDQNQDKNVYKKKEQGDQRNNKSTVKIQIRSDFLNSTITHSLSHFVITWLHKTHAKVWRHLTSRSKINEDHLNICGFISNKSVFLALRMNGSHHGVELICPSDTRANI